MENENNLNKQERFNSLQRIKRDFFSYRNGVLADILRKSGSPFSIIFGLTLPQITEIALANGKNASLSRQLWKNNSTRCSMLIAPMLMPKNTLSLEEAREWIKDIPAHEVADILCMKLLSDEPYASTLILNLSTGNAMDRYVALRLIMNLIRKNHDFDKKWYQIASFERLRNDSSKENILLSVNIIEEFESRRSE